MISVPVWFLIGSVVVFYFLGHANGVADEKQNAQELRELDAE